MQSRYKKYSVICLQFVLLATFQFPVCVVDKHENPRSPAMIKLYERRS